MDEPNSYAVLRGYYSDDGCSGSTQGAGASAHGGASNAAQTGPPDAASLVIRALRQPACLYPADMLALPVPCEGRLSGVLMLNWGPQSDAFPQPAAPAATTTVAAAAAPAPASQAHDVHLLPVSGQQPQQPSRREQPEQQPQAGARTGGGADRGRRGDSGHHGVTAGGSAGEEMVVSSEDLGRLLRLAQVLMFGLLGDARRARTLEAVVRRLSGIPRAPSLQHFSSALLDAVPEILLARFGLDMLAVFVLSHGAGDSLPSILFVKKQQLASPPDGSIVALDACLTEGSLGGPATDPWATWGGGVSGGLAEHMDGPEASSSVRAVRISPRQTLLARTLRSPIKQLHAAAAPRPAALEASVSGPAVHAAAPSVRPDGGGTAAAAATVAAPAAVAELRAADSSTYARSSSLHAGGAAAPQPAPPAAPSSSHPAADFCSAVVPNVAAYMLEEGSPCADLLLCSNMLNGHGGSAVLCVQAAPPSPPSSPLPAAAAAAKPPSGSAAVSQSAAALTELFQRLPGGSGGGAAAAVGLARAAVVDASVYGASGGSRGIDATQQPETGPLRALQCQRQFGMYLLLPDPLPRALLEDISSELQQLLGMVLGACHMDGGPLSPTDAGRCNAELLALQQQVLGLGLGLGGSQGPVDAGSGPAGLRLRPGGDAASGIRADASARRLRPLATAMDSASVAPRGEAQEAGGGHGSPLSRSYLARRLGALLSGRSASRTQGPLSQAQVQLAESHTAGFTLASPSATIDGVPGRRLLSTAPEVLLENLGEDASPMQTMLSSMRSGLTAAVASAMATASGEEARSLTLQELEAVRLAEVIGHGGQGVIIHGTLHGLETAVKVIHQGSGGGRARAKQQAAAQAAGGEADPRVADPRDEEYADLLKAKRGALELVVTGALSHPNIVQVLASFPDVILARCSYVGDGSSTLKLFSKDDPALLSAKSRAPPNTVVCLEYCDKGTLLAATRAGAFMLPGAPPDGSGVARAAMVPLYMSLLEVALALRYLHARRLVHCDLKPANVLLRSSSRDPRGWTCKLSDFGCVRLMAELPVETEDDRRQQRPVTVAAAAAQLRQPQPQQQAAAGGRLSSRAGTVLGFRNTKPVGTVAYMAPECFVQGSILGSTVDVYAFGIMMWELLVGRQPYQGVEAKALPRMVAHYHYRPEFSAAPLDYTHLASRCWSAYASRRPTASQLVFELEALLDSARQAEQEERGRISRSLSTAAAAAPSPR